MTIAVTIFGRSISILEEKPMKNLDKKLSKEIKSDNSAIVRRAITLLS